MAPVRVVLCFLSLLATVLGQGQEGQGQESQFASECPEPNGFFADATQCDKYYACKNDVIKEKLCPDGMVFNDLNYRFEKCDFPFQTDCTGRDELQPPQATKHCPRLNGYFPHEDAKVCNQFYYCAGGIGNKITCPATLSFSLKTGTCVWPDQSGRVDCTSKEVLNFTCPKVSFHAALAHPRYPDPDDCQFFYVCINGDTPRRNGCNFGEVFNNKTTSCDQPINVPDCQDYYKEYFEEYFGNLEKGFTANSNRRNAEILAAAIASGFDVPGKPKRVKIDRGGASSSQAVLGAVRKSTRPSGAVVSTNSKPSSARNRLRQKTRRPGRKPTTTTTTLSPDYYYYDYDETAPPAAETSDPPSPKTKPV